MHTSQLLIREGTSALNTLLVSYTPYHGPATVVPDSYRESPVLEFVEDYGPIRPAGDLLIVNYACEYQPPLLGSRLRWNLCDLKHADSRIFVANAALFETVLDWSATELPLVMYATALATDRPICPCWLVKLARPVVKYSNHPDQLKLPGVP